MGVGGGHYFYIVFTGTHTLEPWSYSDPAQTLRRNARDLGISSNLTARQQNPLSYTGSASVSSVGDPDPIETEPPHPARNPVSDHFMMLSLAWTAVPDSSRVFVEYWIMLVAFNTLRATLTWVVLTRIGPYDFTPSPLQQGYLSRWAVGLLVAALGLFHYHFLRYLLLFTGDNYETSRYAIMLCVYNCVNHPWEHKTSDNVNHNQNMKKKFPETEKLKP